MSSLAQIPSYVVITPVRNEGPHFHQTVEAILAQTVRPRTWVIVNDGSNDITPQVIDAVASQHPWIQAIHRKDRGFRKQGGGVIEAFYEGFNRVENGPWEFVVKLDGDLSFSPDYFEQCLRRFALDPQLGIGGGRIDCRVNGSWVEDSPGDPSFHVRGATKIYRRATWEAIGGLLRAVGWDTLDEVKANMLGWKTYSFPQLRVQQLKPTGVADGSWKNWFKNGRANYITGYHPLFMLAKCLKRTVERPYGIAALGLLTGFTTAYLQRVRRVPDPELIKYVRRQQLNRLTFRQSLWDEAPPTCQGQQA